MKMATIQACSSCGYHLSSNEDKCPYCGSRNPNYSAKSDFVGRIFSTTEEKSKEEELPINVNWIAFIVLLIICWPLAVAYILYKYYNRNYSK